MNSNLTADAAGNGAQAGEEMYKICIQYERNVLGSTLCLNIHYITLLYITYTHTLAYGYGCFFNFRFHIQIQTHTHTKHTRNEICKRLQATSS